MIDNLKGMDTIFKNAITSISIGVEDAQISETARNLSAIRNIYSGILLLFKEKLLRLSPDESKEVLIKSKIHPVRDKDGNIVFVGKGKGTVNFTEIKDRFDSLSITTDWKRLEKIQKTRNNLEHYLSKDDPKKLVDLLNDSFIIIRNFLVDELEMNPIEVFDSEIWEVFLNNNEVFEEEKRYVDISLKKLKLPDRLKQILVSMSCYYCGSELVVLSESQNILDVKGECRICGMMTEGAVLLEEALNDFYFYEEYTNAKHGGELLFEHCPFCSHRTFSNEEKVCYLCEYELDYSECKRCGISLTVDEQHFEGFCSYCAHMIEKVMND